MTFIFPRLLKKSAAATSDQDSPDGGVLIAGFNARVASGEWVRIDGASGLGKSSLLRTLQGIWPCYQGDWQVPAGRSSSTPCTWMKPPESSALQLMALLKAELPTTTVIGSSHQPSAALFFDRHLSLVTAAAPAPAMA